MEGGEGHENFIKRSLHSYSSQELTAAYFLRNLVDQNQYLQQNHLGYNLIKAYKFNASQSIMAMEEGPVRPKEIQGRAKIFLHV